MCLFFFFYIKRDERWKTNIHFCLYTNSFGFVFMTFYTAYDYPTLSFCYICIIMHFYLFYVHHIYIIVPTGYFPYTTPPYFSLMQKFFFFYNNSYIQNHQQSAYNIYTYNYTKTHSSIRISRYTMLNVGYLCIYIWCIFCHAMMLFGLYNFIYYLYTYIYI